LAPEVDYASPEEKFTFDLNKSPLFKKDDSNFIHIAGQKQLNTLKNVSLLDIFLSKNNVIEPHYHPNAAELIYCISGAVAVSILNPFSKRWMNFPIKPGQIVNIPRGWWHYIVTLSDGTHLLAIFDAPNPEVVLGSDLLKLTPPSILAQTYCMDENQWKKTVAPVQPSTFIGPPKGCTPSSESRSKQFSLKQYPYSPYLPTFPYGLYPQPFPPSWT